jgi:hypothetical protein
MTRAWSKSSFPRPYIWRLTSLSLQIWPSAWPLDQPGLVPSLGASRFLRRRHQYYEPVRRPTSARIVAPASPRHHPPPETNLAAPVGPLMFRRLLFMRDPAIDPGEATPSRIAMAHVLPSRTGTLSTSAIFHLSRLIPAPRMTPVYASDPALLFGLGSRRRSALQPNAFVTGGGVKTSSLFTRIRVSKPIESGLDHHSCLIRHRGFPLLCMHSPKGACISANR